VGEDSYPESVADGRAKRQKAPATVGRGDWGSPGPWRPFQEEWERSRIGAYSASHLYLVGDDAPVIHALMPSSLSRRSRWFRCAVTFSVSPLPPPAESRRRFRRVAT
jgi:hypothetical protein